MLYCDGKSLLYIIVGLVILFHLDEFVGIALLLGGIGISLYLIYCLILLLIFIAKKLR